MEKSERTRTEIMNQTIELIRENGGNTDKVTIRDIAGRSHISVGLVNHYFATKEQLIEACVQSIIQGVIHAFRPDVRPGAGRAERLANIAGQVADFLMDNPQISRISVLSDLTAPGEADNTMNSVKGFAWSLSGGQPPDSEDLLNAFLLTIVLQGAFLRKDVLKQTIGVDFAEKSERGAFLSTVAKKLIQGGNEIG